MSHDPLASPPAPVAIDGAERKTLEPFTCLGCGCHCDDLAVTLQGQSAVAVERACPLGRDFIFQGSDTAEDFPVAVVRGHPVTIEEALEASLELLAEAQSPLVLLLLQTATETAAAAIELAEKVGAAVEIGLDATPSASALAYQRGGRVSATLGEVKDRADVVLFWYANPVVTHPRHWERYSVEPRGRFVSGGRQGRRVLVVGESETETAQLADRFFRIPRDREMEVIWTLRALVKNCLLDPKQVARTTGCDLSALSELAGELVRARYGAWFHGPSERADSLAVAAATLEATAALVRDLNERGRFVLLGMGETGNRVGLEAALTWQTGFPASVDFAAGAPESIPGVTSARARLQRGEVDLVVVVGAFANDRVGSELIAVLGQIPTIWIGPAGAALNRSLTVHLVAGAIGCETGGTVFRADGVAIPVRPHRPCRLMTDRSWVEALMRHSAT